MTSSQRLRRPPEYSTGQSTRWNRLPAGIALRHIGIIAGRIGTVVPSLRRVGLAVIVIRIIAQPGKSERSTDEKSVTVETTVVEPVTVEPATVEHATVEPATVEPATVEPATVEPPTPTVKATAATVEPSGVGGI